MDEPVSDDLYNRNQVRIIMLLRDLLPPFRPDVAVLFGTALPLEGVSTDLIGLCDSSTDTRTVTWSGGSVWAMGHDERSIRGELRGLRTDFYGLARRLCPEHDIVQVRDKIRAGVVGLIWARLYRRPFVYWMSYPLVESYKARVTQIGSSRGGSVFVLNGVRFILAKFFFNNVIIRCADHIFVQSDTMRDTLLGRGVMPGRLTAVPMGVDVRAFLKATRPEIRPPELVGRRALVYLGTLARARQSEFLLDVLLAVRRQVPDAMLLLVGDGANPEECLWFRECIRERQLGTHVFLTGWLPQSEALSLVTCAEIGLSPIPRGELFDVSSPTKVLEYLALGIPCIGNDIPDQQLVIVKSGGGLSVPMEPSAFANAAISLLSDSAIAIQMGTIGRKWVIEHRGYDKLARIVSPVYKTLASKRLAQ